MNNISSNQPQHYILRRNRLSRKTSPEDRLKAGIGSLAGVAIPMALMMKKQGVKNPFNLKYGLGDMLTLSGTSILGGVSAGMLGNDKETNEAKAREGLFQFLNASIPTWLTGAAIRLCETTPKYNTIPAKIFSIAGSLLIGMHGAASVSNLICDPKDKYPDRKLDLKDSLANLDDMLGILVLAKFPMAKELHLEKALPFIYSYCGYRAGKSN